MIWANFITPTNGPKIFSFNHNNNIKLTILPEEPTYELKELHVDTE